MTIEQTKELRVGNYVLYNGSSGRVYSIVGPHPYKDKKLDGKVIIELSIGGLLDATENEVEFIDTNDDILINHLGFDSNTCVLKLDDNLFFGKDTAGNIRLGYADEWISRSLNYIHEIQNMYFSLKHEELEIK